MRDLEQDRTVSIAIREHEPAYTSAITCPQPVLRVGRRSVVPWGAWKPSIRIRARAQEPTLFERAAWRDIPTSANVRRGMRTCTGAGPAVLGDLASGTAAIGRWEVSLELKVGSRCGPGEGCVAEGEHPAVRGHQPVPALSRCDRDADDGGVEVCGAG